MSSAPRNLRLLRWALIFIGAGILSGSAVAIANWWILSTTRALIARNSDQLRQTDVGLVLGTAPTLRTGGANPFFDGRIEAAAGLYRLRKVRHLLLSGDNSRADYDEPSAMKQRLIERGIPAEAITLDYAGFRTLDSMARARRVFGLERVTVITDDFHQPRALFLAQAHGLQASGFPSGHVDFSYSAKTRLREVLSRVKACLDVYVFGTQPKFFGPTVSIPIAGQAAR